MTAVVAARVQSNKTKDQALTDVTSSSIVSSHLSDKQSLEFSRQVRCVDSLHKSLQTQLII